MSEVCLSALIAEPFHSVHSDLRRMRHSEYWLKGGRGSTKSSFASIEVVLGMLRDPDANAIVYRKVAATLRESVYAQIEWAIGKLNVADWFMFRKSPLEIIYKPTGQRILFRGADDPGKSKSIKLATGYFKYLWIEEPTEFNGMDEIRTIKASIIRGGGPAATILSYNPPISQRNWINREVLENNENRAVHHSCYLNVPREWLGERFWGDAENLKATNERAYRHMYLGEVTGTGGAVFENVETREITDDEIGRLGYFYPGIDWGYYPDPFQWVRCSFDAARRTLYIIDEYRALKLGNRAVYDDLARTGRLNAYEEIIADNAEPKSINDFRDYGAAIRATVKGPGSVDYSMKWLQSLAKIIIDPVRCPCAAKEFGEYEYERNRDGDLINGYPDRENHVIDAVRYACSPLWRRRGM